MIESISRNYHQNYLNKISLISLGMKLVHRILASLVRRIFAIVFKCISRSSGKLFPLFFSVAYIFFKDPWNYRKKAEVFRFEQTNKIIEREFGKLNTVLELGCGEGHQSKYLMKLCNKLIGIDVSSIATRRAKKLLPEANFHSMKLETALLEFPIMDSNSLAIAAEVLYYVKDKEEVIQHLQENYNQAVVSFYKTYAHQLGPIMTANNWSGPEEIIHGKSHFYVYWHKSENQAQ